MTSAGAVSFVCPDCRIPVERDGDAFACRSCSKVFPIEAGIADFSGGSYSDVFSPERDVTPELEQCLGDEEAGTRARIADFYLPRFRRIAIHGRPLRVLDCGCGNGLSVDLLSDAGIEAWGNDVSLVRKWQWRERRHPERLLIGSGARLPFPDGYFDAVVSCGVLEHVGVIESSGPPYTVRAAPGQRESRVAFVRELLRVVRAPGRLWLDFPNGRHPIDFWHGTGAGGARFHPLDEGFLPSVAEARDLLASAGPGCRARAISPHRRLRFKRVRRRWYGLLFSPAITAFFTLMRVPGFRWLAASPLNPFLVIEIENLRPSTGAADRAASVVVRRFPPCRNSRPAAISPSVFLHGDESPTARMVQKGQIEQRTEGQRVDEGGGKLVIEGCCEPVIAGIRSSRQTVPSQPGSDPGVIDPICESSLS